MRARVALVPSWQPFVAFAALAGVVIAGLAVVARRSRVAPPLTVRSAVLPAFALLLLVVPYLPVVPDWWPAVQALAGPGAWMLWAVVVALLLWTVAPHAAGVATWWRQARLSTQTAVVWIVTALAAAGGARQLTHTVLFPSGDEPHYLVIAQSLWRDHDLKIENNHKQRDYAEYFGRDLDPHYLTRGTDGEIYSVHPIGMPVLIAPLYAAGGYDLVVATFIALAATAATLVWRWALATTGALGTTTLAWAAIVLSSPYLINAFTVYPEVPSALAVAIGLTLALRPRPDARPWHDLAIGCAAAALPWLSTKYAPMSAALVAVALGRRVFPLHLGETRAGLAGAAARLLTPYAVSLAGWFAFFQAYWGKPWPSAPYGRLVQTELANTVFGVPGLIFDQEYGILVYAPAYLLAGFGVWTMLRRPGPLRRLALELVLVFSGLIGTVGAFRIWWGGSAAPGRPITSGLLVLLLPMAVQLGTAAPGSARRAAQHVLIWLGVALSLVVLGAEGGLLVNNDRDGTSSLLEWLSPRWPLWTLAPTFIAHEARRAWLDSGVWLGAAIAGSWLLARVRPATRGGAALIGLLATVATVGVASVVMIALPTHTPELPGIDLRARARLPGLDSFDAVTRPLGVRDAPLRVEAASAVEPTLALEVAPGLRTAPQPVRVLHNGRFSLPAGRYHVAVTWAPRDPLPARAGATVALQVGRIGAPLTTWTVTPEPGGTWTETFWLPVDAGFVAFRGSPEIERSIADLRVEPVAVVDEGTRVATPQVLAAAQYGPVMVLLHDELMYAEARGFWTPGERPARVTVACEGGCTHGLTLRVHGGKINNVLHLATHGWTRDVTLYGETLVDVAVPPPADGGVILLDTRTDRGFVPIEVDPSIRDRRYLGAWIEVAPRKEAP
ncbi:MAG: hypothetical protein U0802_21355 [Candidatus Binatia bacterium]